MAVSASDMYVATNRRPVLECIVEHSVHENGMGLSHQKKKACFVFAMVLNECGSLRIREKNAAILHDATHAVQRPGCHTLQSELGQLPVSILTRV